MALAAVILAASPTWHMALVAAPLLGAGYGTYWAAAPALLTQVLPAAADRAKDLGLINIAYSLPLVVAPLIAGVVLGLDEQLPGAVRARRPRDSHRGRDSHPRPFGAMSAYTKSISSGILVCRRQYVEVTLVTNWAFRSTRGLVGGLTILLAAALAIGLSACGAPQYTYVADTAAKTYYKVPYNWHQISQQALNAALQAAGGSGAGVWSTAFDAGTAPSGRPFPRGRRRAAVRVRRGRHAVLDGEQRTVLQHAARLHAAGDVEPPTGRRGQRLPAHQLQAAAGPDDHRHAKVSTGCGRRSSTRSPAGSTDTFDEDVLTNADQTVVYFLMVHCTNSCYSQNQDNINTVMSSFTVGSPT